MSEAETMSRTEKRFRAAFERLKAGTPERKTSRGKISLNKIAIEAGYDGTYIHNKAFAALKAKLNLEIGPANKVSPDKTDYTTDPQEKIDKLRDERNNETRLKEKYRNQLDENAAIQDATLILNTSLAHRIIELESRERRRNESNVLPFNQN